MDKITPNLWFDGNAEEAASFYVSLFPDSRIDSILRSPADNPSTRKGEVVVVEFTLGGQSFVGIDGGRSFPLPKPYLSPSSARINLKWIATGSFLSLTAAAQASVAGARTGSDCRGK